MSFKPRFKLSVFMALMVALALTPSRPAFAISAPAVPSDIVVPAGNRVFLVGHAGGTQNYICLPSGSGFAWTLFGPQATLFDDRDAQIVTHFASPNPDEGGTTRPTWQSSLDTSAVWARAIATSTDADFVAPGAIPWLKLEIVGREKGPTGGGLLFNTTYIQRVNTAGGPAPATGCDTAANVGARTFVPYTADYFFFTDKGRTN